LGAESAILLGIECVRSEERVSTYVRSSIW